MKIVCTCGSELWIKRDGKLKCYECGAGEQNFDEAIRTIEGQAIGAVQFMPDPDAIRKENIMAKYRKKPVVVDAVQYVEYGRLVKGMCNSNTCYTSGKPDCQIPHVHTIHDNQIVPLEVMDWILPEPDGKHFYPCKPDIFEATYEKVDDDGDN